MGNNILVSLPKNWIDISKQNPNGPFTFVREEYKKNFKNYLQFSFLKYEMGKEPNPSENDLIIFAKNAGTKAGFGILKETNSGDCKFGKFGKAVFSKEENLPNHVWYLSNGKDFILASYLCMKSPHKLESEEVENIVFNVLYT